VRFKRDGKEESWSSLEGGYRLHELLVFLEVTTKQLKACMNTCLMYFQASLTGNKEGAGDREPMYRACRKGGPLLLLRPPTLVDSRISTAPYLPGSQATFKGSHSNV
jgi:hypothetical protein